MNQINIDIQVASKKRTSELQIEAVCMVCKLPVFVSPKKSMDNIICFNCLINPKAYEPRWNYKEVV